MEAFQTYFIDILKNKYCQFDGRARRKEYWMFYLFYYVAIFILGIISAVFAGIFADTSLSFISFIPMIALGIFILGTIPTVLGLLWRRLHDTNKSGLWFLISLIPFGSIVLFVFTVLDSQPGANQYGPNPKGMESQAASDVFV